MPWDCTQGWAMMAGIFRMNIAGNMSTAKPAAVAPTKNVAPAAALPKPNLQREPDFQRLAIPKAP